MVRIISGECKGRLLSTLKGRAVRPTSDRAKETLFNIIGDRIPGCRFLDLFSGTGNIGLEAASRGAAEVVLVESNPKALNVLQENVEKCDLGDKVKILNVDSGKCLAGFVSTNQSFDLVFMDPPYRDLKAYNLIREIVDKGLLENKGVVIAEHDRHHSLPEAYGKLVLVREKRVGDTIFSFFGG